MVALTFLVGTCLFACASDALTSPVRKAYSRRVSRFLSLQATEVATAPKQSYFPYGAQSFAGIRRDGRFFVDKMEEMLELLELGDNASKSLFVDMLATFLDNNTSDDDFNTFFDGLHVHPEEKRGNHCRKYYVMQFNLAVDACGGDVEKIRRLMNDKINLEVRSFVRRYKLDGVVLYPENGLASLEDAATVLADTRPGAELYILVDEYDRSTNELMAMGDLDSYNAAVKDSGGGGSSSSSETGPLRALLTAIKNLPSAGVPVRAFVTGLAPISLADPSSANNVKSITFEESIAGMFGFMRVDVERGLSAHGHLSGDDKFLALEFMTAFFDGYLYDSETKDPEAARLYNRQLCLNFLQMLCKKQGLGLLRAWQAGTMTAKQLVRMVDDPNVQISESALNILSRSPLTLTDIATLVGRGRIECTLSEVREVFKFAEMLQGPTGGDQEQNDKQRAPMLAFMFAHGNVTFAEAADDDFDKIALVAPNEMAREKLLENLRECLQLDSSEGRPRRAERDGAREAAREPQGVSPT